MDVGITDRDESTGGACCTDAGTRVARTGCAENRENVNHIGTLDHISIYERSEDNFELVGEGKHNVSYNTTDNNTIISHLSINKYSKTNSNPQKGKSDRAGKENSDVEYTSFRNEIIKDIAETKAISMSELGNFRKIKINKS